MTSIDDLFKVCVLEYLNHLKEVLMNHVTEAILTRRQTQT